MAADVEFAAQRIACGWRAGRRCRRSCLSCGKSGVSSGSRRRRECRHRCRRTVRQYEAVPQSATKLAGLLDTRIIRLQLAGNRIDDRAFRSIHILRRRACAQCGCDQKHQHRCFHVFPFFCCPAWVTSKIDAPKSVVERANTVYSPMASDVADTRCVSACASLFHLHHD